MPATNRVLVIEDDESIREALREFLEDNDYNVTVAADGVEGIKEAIRNPPNVILLDIMMPKLDGFQTCEALRQEEAMKVVERPNGSGYPKGLRGNRICPEALLFSIADEIDEILHGVGQSGKMDIPKILNQLYDQSSKDPLNILFDLKILKQLIQIFSPASKEVSVPAA